MGRRKKRYKSVFMAVKLPPRVAEEIDRLIERGLYDTRSEFLRDAIRRLLAYYSQLDRGCQTYS